MSPRPQVLAIFAAMSQVKRIRRILAPEGGFAVERTPHALSPGGCSASILCTLETLPRVLEAARSLSIEPSGIARLTDPDGPWVLDPAGGA